MSASPVLGIESLDVEFATPRSRTLVLRGVTLSIGPGRIHGLVGESGGGKTMVGRTIIDLLPGPARVVGGSIRFEGRDLLAVDRRQRRALLGRSIAMIMQNPMTALNPVYRIKHQVMDVLRLHVGLTSSEAYARSVELLTSVHIKDPERVMDLYPHELSGGMCQRVAISAAFACEPKLIIADEPTTALDVTVQHQILRLIRELQRKCGTSVLFITHDLGIVAKICDEVSVIYAGRVLESASVDAVFSTNRHPYTSALLDAAPRYDQPQRLLRPIPSELRLRLLAEARAYDDARANT